MLQSQTKHCSKTSAAESAAGDSIYVVSVDLLANSHAAQQTRMIETSVASSLRGKPGSVNWKSMSGSELTLLGAHGVWSECRTTHEVKLVTGNIC